VAAAAIPGVGVIDRVVAAATSAAHASATIGARARLPRPTGHRGRIAPTDPTAALPPPVPSEATGAIAPREANGGIEAIARAAGIAWVAPIEIAIGIAPSGRSNRVRRR